MSFLNIPDKWGHNDITGRGVQCISRKYLEQLYYKVGRIKGGKWIPLTCWLEQGRCCQKSFLFAGCPFLGPLTRESHSSWRLLGVSGVLSGLEAIREPTDHPALACRSSGLSVPGSPLSSSPFSVFLGLLPCTSGDFLVVRQDLEGWGCSTWWNRLSA